MSDADYRRGTQIFLFFIGEDHTFNFGSWAEVQEQADFNSARSQIVQELRFVHGFNGAACFEFDYYDFIDHQIRMKIPDQFASKPDW